MNQESPVYTLHKFVFALDRAADKILQQRLKISQSRAVVLVMVYARPSITQHQLAVALGRSDPAISALLSELSKDGYVVTKPNPEHMRKRIVTLTKKGETLAKEARDLLDTRFGTLLANAGINADTFSNDLERLYQTLMTEKSGDNQ